MYYLLERIKKDHLEMQAMLREIESNINERMPREKILLLLDKLGHKWNIHEEEEEKLFNYLTKLGLTAPVKKTIIQEHRELQGHWKVLRLFVWNGENKKMYTALETDGKMLINKFYRHMEQEEKMFKQFESKFQQEDI